MFDVGFAELFLLGVVGLLVLGPERLPAVARTLGGLVRKARSSWYNLRRSIETELAAADLSEPVRSARAEWERVSSDLSKPLDENTTKPAESLQSDAPENPAGDPPPAP
jgi:sec-independent protein translocase protein TatB